MIAESGAPLSTRSEATAGGPVDRALELAHLYSRRDPSLVRDVKRALQIAQDAGRATVLESQTWAPSSSVTKADFRAIVARSGRTGDT